MIKENLSHYKENFSRFISKKLAGKLLFQWLKVKIKKRRKGRVSETVLLKY